MLKQQLGEADKSRPNGSYMRHAKHRPLGLSHFQPKSRPPTGHTFYGEQGMSRLELTI